MNTSTWICDSCGAPINAIDHGWVEWLVREEGDEWVGKGLRLVHHVAARNDYSCQYDGKAVFANGRYIISDFALKEGLGPDGLMRLLSMIEGEGRRLPTGEIIEMIQRLHLPGYEAARPHMKEAIEQGAVEPNLPKGFYWQYQIKAALDFESRPI